MDFVAQRLPDGRWIRVLTMVDQFTRECLTLFADNALSGEKDPFFAEKVRDVVGLYLNPLDHAVVLSIDEKSQIQALNRTQPVLPMGLGYVEGVTHDSVRHGTTTLFAALDIATGTVLTECKPRHRHQKFLGFLERIDQAVPTALDVHLIVDNYSTHKHARASLVGGKAPVPRPLHPNLLLLAQSGGALVRTHHPTGHPPQGSFKSVKDLMAKINRFTQNYNRKSRPFAWTATADSIFKKLATLCTRISRTELPHDNRSTI